MKKTKLYLLVASVIFCGCTFSYAADDLPEGYYFEPGTVNSTMTISQELAMKRKNGTSEGEYDDKSFHFPEKEIKRGYKLAETGKYQEALVIFKKNIQHDEDLMKQDKYTLGDIYYIMGYCYGKLGNKENLEKYFKKSLEVWPECQTPLYELGLFYKKEGRIDEAIEIWERLLKINGAHDLALYEMGLIYEDRGSLWQAQDYFKAAAQLGNPDAEAKVKGEDWNTRSDFFGENK